MPLDFASELVRKGGPHIFRSPDCSEGLLVTASFLYLLARRVLALVLLRFRSTKYKQLEIIVLRQEPVVVRRQVHRLEARARSQRSWPRPAGFCLGPAGNASSASARRRRCDGIVGLWPVAGLIPVSQDVLSSPLR